LGPGSVEADQLVLKVRAPARRGASHAPNQVEAPVKVDHRPAPGGLMQTVDVLGLGRVKTFYCGERRFEQPRGSRIGAEMA
jgi:hypothetical protein